MKKAFVYILKSIKWILVGVAGLLLLVLLMLYLPPVQDFAVGKALGMLNSKGDMHIGVKKLRLTFPLDLRIDSLTMATPGMEIAASRADASIEVLPLLKGHVNTGLIGLRDAVVNIGTPDSSLYMRANLAKAGVRNASVALFSQTIDIELLTASHGTVEMAITPDTIAKTDTASAPVEWQVTLAKAQLRDIEYAMEMLPTIASLDCKLPLAILTDGNISLAENRVDVGELAISGIDARYLTPSAKYLAEHPADTLPRPAEADTTSSTPWTINARRLRIVNSHALYAMEGTVASANFDPSYIEASQINIEIDSFRNHGAEITVPLRRFSARERCGIALNASGTFSMDSTSISAEGFSITTPASTISLNAMMGLESSNPPLSLNLGAELAMEDVERLVPAGIAPMIASMPRYVPLKVTADATGRMENLEIRRISAELPRHLTISMKGAIADYSDINKARGDLEITGALLNGDFLKPTLFDAKMRRQVNLPPLRLAGQASVNRGIIDGNVKAITGNGLVALDAMWNNRRQAYNVELNLKSFPIQSILPQAGARDITAAVTLTGVGIDPFSPKTEANAKIDLTHATYMGREYTGITLNAIVGNGHADIDAQSTNRAANFSLQAAGNLAGEEYDWTFNGNVRNIDLRALALSDTTADGSVALSGTARFRPPLAPSRRNPGRPMNIDADLLISDFYWHMPGDAVNGSGISLKFNAADSSTSATLANHDMSMRFAAPVNLDTLMAQLTDASALLSRNMKRRRIAVDSIQQALPPFSLTINAGKNNIISNYLAGRDISFSTFGMNLSNDTIINGGIIARDIEFGKTRLDTITLSLHQKGAYLLYEAAMNNRTGTLDQFAHAEAKGYLNADRLALLLKQQNLEGETGYSLGLMASMTDSTTVGLRFVPFHPIIGYKEWEINRDNFIRFNMATNHLDANINLFNDVSSLKLFTQHVETDSAHQEDIILQLKDIKLSDWLAINPFAPAITGDLSADMRLGWEKPDLNGRGTVTLANLTYGKERVGDFGLDLNVKTNTSGTISARTTLSVNGVKAITANGNLNDSTAANPFMLDFKMIRFPLAVANPFLPPGTARLHGMLNGEMDITGDMSNPVFNGFIDFDSTSVDITMLGTPLKFSEEPIPVENNIARFDNFTLTALNNNPLKINGTVAFESLSDPHLDLALKARNMQIVGAQKTRKSQVYGKAFIDLDAKARGSMQLLDIDAALELLPGSNVTYVMLDAISNITSRSNQDMVKFVNFNDTAAVIEADTVARPSMMMNLDARLTISTGTTVSVELSADGKNKVQLQSAGTLNYTMDYMDDQRFTGRLNLNGGFVRYSIPVMGEKMFTFNEGSYVVFNGDMMNPQLNIDATDNIRANVSQSGTNSRVVNFDVGLSVTGTLNEMNVVFDLSCPDDLTIANELKSMTPEQRANQAMNLLITGTYRSGGTQTISGGNAGTNALFSFLESQLNSWASSAIKGVDLSFGINQYDKTIDGANTTTMSYSYRVSKSLFDDRFKIVVGGNYATDAEADENFAQNLISDISFEYMLNKAGTMYVRLFRHTGYESILEGEITQTGVGFVYKKKIHRLGDIFNFLRRNRKTDNQPSLPPPPQLSPGAAPVPHPADNTNNVKPQPAIKPENSNETAK